jgi:uncharacterized protein YcfJ
VQEELWSTACRLSVYNGVRIAVTNLKEHLPSHMVIAGANVLITYGVQPPTCYGCHEQEHHYQDCPRRRETVSQGVAKSQPSCADIVTSGPVNQQPKIPRETVPHIQSTHKVGKQDATNPSPIHHEAPSVSASNTDEDFLMDINQ